jgi:MerC mercury resistance protein
MTSESRQHRLDGLGLAISAVCLVHCLAFPIIAVLVPAFSFGLDHRTDHVFHWVLLGLAAPISSLALWRGAVRSRNWRWLKCGSVGLVLMLIGVLHVFGAGSEIALTMAGVVLLAVAHVKNFLQTNHTGHRAHSYAIQDGGGTMPAVSIEDES